MGRVTALENFSIHTETVGDDDADYKVVFLHGLFGRGKNFSRIAAGLTPEAQSLLVDLPNHGQSDWTEKFDYLELADMVAAELQKSFAADGPVNVVGHSMGGKVAMLLALRHPELVHKLVVLDISPTTATSGRGEFQHLLGSLTGLDLSTIERRSDADEQLKDKIDHPTVRGFLLQNLRYEPNGFRWEPNLDLLYRELETIMAFPEGLTEQFEGPVLWIGGGRSDYVTDEDVPAMRALFPRTHRMTFKEAGHWIHSEQADETIATLRYFFSR
ncbi:alpha/beta fold hydrolase [Micrococcoides hystricis]|uniref:Alpha/beta fold hydrolase n=1 Tax=Micrococcoides hystricis TaxID=1572761 RepID=A0ABV6P8G8_9MICC